MLVKLSEDWLYLNKTENNFLRLKNKQIETLVTKSYTFTKLKPSFHTSEGEM